MLYAYLYERWNHCVVYDETKDRHDVVQSLYKPRKKMLADIRDRIKHFERQRICLETACGYPLAIAQEVMRFAMEERMFKQWAVPKGVEVSFIEEYTDREQRHMPKVNGCRLFAIMGLLPLIMFYFFLPAVGRIY